MEKLTKREQEILDRIVQGKNNVEISKELSISESTVKAFCSSIFRKMQVNNRVSAAVKALKKGLIWI